MKHLLLITLIAVSCGVKDKELQRLEQRQLEIKEQAVKDSIRFERIERLINAGATYEEAEHFVDSTYYSTTHP